MSGYGKAKQRKMAGRDAAEQRSKKRAGHGRGRSLQVIEQALDAAVKRSKAERRTNKLKIRVTCVGCRFRFKQVVDSWAEADRIMTVDHPNTHAPFGCEIKAEEVG